VIVGQWRKASSASCDVTITYHISALRAGFCQFAVETVTIRLYRVRAVVLRQHKLGEATGSSPSPVTTGCACGGQGVRHPESSRARLEPFAHRRSAASGRNLDIVTQVQAIDAFSPTSSTTTAANLRVLP